MRELYVCVTLYHLYLTMLFINNRKSKKRCAIVLNANDQKIYIQFCKLAEKLRENGYIVFIHLRNKKFDIIGLESLQIEKQYSALNKLMGGGMDGNFILFNFAWNMQYVYTNANVYLKKCKEAYFIEEGALTVINAKRSSLRVWIKKLTGGIVDLYKYEKLKKIYVQEPQIYPEVWQDKIVILDLEELLYALDRETEDTEVKRMLLKLFLGDYLNEIESKIDGDFGILYTQPLSEDGIISESTKINYYRKMVRFYSKYGKMIMKLHPRDTTEYRRNYFDGVIVLPGFFPSELINLLDIEFKFAVGICTSAVETTNAKIKLNINKNFLKDKKFYLINLNY